jgi:hypothetical protein
MAGRVMGAQGQRQTSERTNTIILRQERGDESRREENAQSKIERTLVVKHRQAQESKPSGSKRD